MIADRLRAVAKAYEASFWDPTPEDVALFREAADTTERQAVVVERARALVMGMKLDPVKNSDGSPNETWAGDRVAEAQAVIDALFDLGLGKGEGT
jgi:hypothetical protein